MRPVPIVLAFFCCTTVMPNAMGQYEVIGGHHRVLEGSLSSATRSPRTT